MKGSGEVPAQPNTWTPALDVQFLWAAGAAETGEGGEDGGERRREIIVPGAECVSGADRKTDGEREGEREKEGASTSPGRKSFR